MTWPQYTADREEYLGLSPNLTVRFKMRADKMALWNKLLPSIAQTLKPTTSSQIPTTSTETEGEKGINYTALNLKSQKTIKLINGKFLFGFGEYGFESALEDFLLQIFILNVSLLVLHCMP